MKFEVTFLEKRGSAVMRRPRQIEVVRLRSGLRFGRGTDNEVQLSDIRVDLTAAAMFPRSGMFSIQSVGPSSLLVNGRRTHSAIIGVGDEFLIGPYRIVLTEPPAGSDAALSVELVQPLGDTLARLSSQVRLRLDEVVYSKRAVSWLGFLLIFVTCLAGPGLAYFFERSPVRDVARSSNPAVTLAASLWEPGEVSNSHRFFGRECAVCHRSSFASVPDAACISCHEGDARHAVVGTNKPHRVIGAAQCTGCHEEHRGSHGIVISDSKLCLQCHATLAKTMPGTKTPDIAGFAQHPQFRVSLVADAAAARFRRVELGSAPPPEDRPGIKFSHAAHLAPGGFPALGYQPMTCADCHRREPSGQGFLAITYKGQCERCHQLNFERQDLPWPKGRVPHGDDAGIAAAVWNFFAGKALQGEIAAVPPAPAVTRLAAGTPRPVEPASLDAKSLAWVSQQAETALRTIVFDEKRGCAYCHFGTGPDGTFPVSIAFPAGGKSSPQDGIRLIAPVAMETRFLPFARFDHAKHTAMNCDQCHAARQAETSGTVMIPGIETCKTCHGSQQAAQKAESACISCHAFHRGALGLTERADAPAD